MGILVLHVSISLRPYKLTPPPLLSSPPPLLLRKRHLDHLLQKLPGLVAAENGGAAASANAYSSYVGAEYEGNPLTCAAEFLVEKPPKEFVRFEENGYQRVKRYRTTAA
jgi:hypothetical protein